MVDGSGQRVGVWLLELDGDLRVVSRAPKGITVYLVEKRLRAKGWGTAARWYNMFQRHHWVAHFLICAFILLSFHKYTLDGFKQEKNALEYRVMES